jgi:6-phosphogluconate dehydrogenase
MKLQDVGLIGLAVMDQSLVLNMERNDFGRYDSGTEEVIGDKVFSSVFNMTS